LYFLGALDYRPNAEAVESLITEIAPRLTASGTPVEILLAGKGLSPELSAKLSGTGITYTGFLPSLDDFLSACDVMLNPVLTGGGIKTKAVEALAWGKRVVSCSSGAAGLDRTVCGEALYVSEDGDWDGFVADILQAAQTDAIAPESFYRFYHWGQVAQNVLQTIFPEIR
jgi:glycosyltransferase involved in cell wall biosynthesis